MIFNKNNKQHHWVLGFFFAFKHIKDFYLYGALFDCEYRKRKQHGQKRRWRSGTNNCVKKFEICKKRWSTCRSSNARTHTYIHTYTDSHALTHTYTYMNLWMHMNALTHSNIHIYNCIIAYIHSYNATCNEIHTHENLHARTEKRVIIAQTQWFLEHCNLSTCAWECVNAWLGVRVQKWIHGNTCLYI